MRVAISTELAISADRAWAEVQTPQLLAYVSRPLLVFEPVGSLPLPSVWQDGRFHVRIRLFGIVPLGRQWIVTSKPAPYHIRDDGHGSLTSRWDHLIAIHPIGPTRCRYSDTVEVESGLLTPLVWAFARLFYAHRQRRWRKLVRDGFSY